MKKLSITLACLLLAIHATAQDDFVEHMNAIKLSGEYYFAHSRGDSEEVAYKKCINDVLSQVRQNHKGSFNEAFIRQESQKRTKDGNPCRVFVYLKKSSVAKAKGETPKIILKRDLAMEETKPDPIPAPDPTPAPKPEPVPTPKPKPVPTPKPEPVYQPVSKPTPVPKDVPAIGNGNTLLSRIVDDIKTRNGIRAAFESFKAKKDLGIATGFGPLKSATDIERVYIVIYNRDANTPCAILTPTETEGGVRKNLMTGTPDSYTNYHNVEAFWFTIK